MRQQSMRRTSQDLAVPKRLRSKQRRTCSAGIAAPPLALPHAVPPLAVPLAAPMLAAPRAARRDARAALAVAHRSPCAARRAATRRASCQATQNNHDASRPAGTGIGGSGARPTAGSTFSAFSWPDVLGTVRKSRTQALLTASRSAGSGTVSSCSSSFFPLPPRPMPLPNFESGAPRFHFLMSLVHHGGFFGPWPRALRGSLNFGAGHTSSPLSNFS
mmetsp:Transcript_41408/g.113952  ORF Transcript_41408/g.113952 Transcript_41408/m.113952 type:complete len:217 (-) Transcript_41408:230-880(-)